MSKVAKLNRRYDTIFAGMKITSRPFNYFLYYFSQGISDKEIEKIINPMQDVNLSLKTIRKYSK